jgi:Uncharacterised nucleotidyltransferase
MTVLAIEILCPRSPRFFILCDMTALSKMPFTTVSPAESSTRDSHEFKFLISCLQVFLKIAPLQQLANDCDRVLNWQQVYFLSRRHKIVPLINHQLNEVSKSCKIPEDVLVLFKKTYAETVHCNLSYTGELIKVLAAFEEALIPVIPFKGPILAATVYQDLSMRSFGDLDLLVSEEELDQAQQLLLSKGYKLHSDFGWECEFIHPQSSIGIDLHYALTPPFFAFPLTFIELQTRQETIAIAGHQVPYFSPEDSLLVLCTQVVKDCYHWRLSLSQLCDIAQFLQTQPCLDWAFIFDQVDRMRCQRVLIFSLLLVQETLGISLPRLVQECISRDTVAHRLSKGVQHRLWHQIDDPLVSAPNSFWDVFRSHRHTFYWQLRTNFFDRLIYVAVWTKFCLDRVLNKGEKRSA